MKTWNAFALLLALGLVPAHAADNDKLDTLRGELELAELERDVDKELLREAMVMAGRLEMKDTTSRPAGEQAQKQLQARRAVLDDFIAAKKVAVMKRTAELKRKAAELSALEKSSAIQRVTPPGRTARPRDDKERQELIESLEEAQIEVQLLQLQTQRYHQPLNDALQALADADFAAANDKSQKEKADAARKRFDEARNKYVQFSKRLQMEQEKVGELRGKLGMGGMMGGGFR